MKKRMILPLMSMVGTLGLGAFGIGGQEIVKTNAATEVTATETFISPKLDHVFKTGTRMIVCNPPYATAADLTASGSGEFDAALKDDGGELHVNAYPDNAGDIKTEVPINADYVITLVGHTTGYFNLTIKTENGIECIGYDGGSGFVRGDLKTYENHGRFLWRIKQVETDRSTMPIRTEIKCMSHNTGFNLNGCSIFCGTYRSSSYVGVHIREDNPEVNDLAHYIMENNEEGQCETKFSEAKTKFLGLTAEQQNVFKTSENIGIKAARERYEAWAKHLGDDKPYEAITTTNLTDLSMKNNMIIATIVITSAVAISAISVLTIKRRRLHK